MLPDVGDPGIYVECRIQGSLDEVWRLTQTPEVHQRWDLRFTTITYLPRSSEDEPQRFLYVTRLLPGIAVRGTGESTGLRAVVGGEATSALKFGSEQGWSLIRTGSGYWRYEPRAEGVRFLTWYDYETRFGWVGRLIDRISLRPAMGWATAWSFDRLRLWIEQGQTPETSFQLAVVYAVARVAVAGVWLWHGMVPKLWFRDAGELTMLAQAGLPAKAVVWAGAAEVVWGLLMLVFWRSRWMFAATAVGMTAALVEVAWRSPQFLTGAFNPVSLNLCVLALSLIGYLVASRVPSAGRCLRRKPVEDQ